VLGQHRQVADDGRQLAIALDREVEGHLALAGPLGPGHVLVIEGVVGGDLLDGLEGEDDVLGRDRPAVVEAGAGAQADRGRAEVGRIGHPFGDKAVGGAGLVGALRHQSVVDQAEADGGAALDRELVERVEAAQRPAAHAAALGSVGIDPVEMLEVGPELGCADEGKGVVLGWTV